MKTKIHNEVLKWIVESIMNISTQISDVLSNLNLNLISKDVTSPGNIINYWRGTGSQYNAITTKDSNTLYAVDSGRNFKLTTDELLLAGDTHSADLKFLKGGEILFVWVLGVLYKYNLSEPFELSSATLDATSLDINSMIFAQGGVSFISSVSISQNGLYVYVSESVTGGAGRIRRLDLPAAFDISSATINSSSFTFPASPYTLTGIDISNDGTKIVFTNQTAPLVVGVVDLSTAYDLSTASISTTNTKTVFGDPFEPVWSNGGRVLSYLRGFNYELIEMSTPYLINTATSTRSIGSSQIGNDGTSNVTIETNSNHAFSDDGRYLYLFARDTNRIVRYETAEDFDFISRTGTSTEFQLYLGDKNLKK